MALLHARGTHPLITLSQRLDTPSDIPFYHGKSPIDLTTVKYVIQYFTVRSDRTVLWRGTVYFNNGRKALSCPYRRYARIRPDVSLETFRSMHESKGFRVVHYCPPLSESGA